MHINLNRFIPKPKLKTTVYETKAIAKRVNFEKRILRELYIEKSLFNKMYFRVNYRYQKSLHSEVLVSKALKL